MSKPKAHTILVIIAVLIFGVIAGAIANDYHGWFGSKASAAESTPAPAPDITDTPKKESPAPDEEPVVESEYFPDKTPTFMTLEERLEVIDARAEALRKKALADHTAGLKRIESLGVAEIESGDDGVVMKEAMKRTKARALADHLLYLDGKETSEEIREKRLQLQEAGLGNLMVDVKRNRHDIDRNQAQIKKNTDAIDEIKKRVENLESKDVEVDERYITPAPEAPDSVSRKPEEQLIESIAWKDPKTEVLKIAHKVTSVTPTGNVVTFINSDGEMQAVDIVPPLMHSLPYYRDGRVIRYNGYNSRRNLIGVSPMAIFQGPGYCLYYETDSYMDAPTVVYGETRWELAK